MDAQAPSSEESWETFGKALQSQRKLAAWSQKKLMQKLGANRIEVHSQGTISKWESGKQRPSPETVEVLEDIFDLPRGQLLHMLRYPTEGLSATEQKSTNWIEEYEAKHGKLPVLPKPLQGLGGSSDQPISKDTKTYCANIGEWNEIKSIPGLEKKWREYLEWKGEDPDEYEYEVRRRGPPGGPGPIRLTYK
jgi:transcriptional regulator with XRE-family HTH domain